MAQPNWRVRCWKALLALADGMDVVHACVEPKSITLIGGGARSAYWRQMLADICGKQFDYRTGGDVGPALGAARRAQLAICKKTGHTRSYYRSWLWSRHIILMPSAWRTMCHCVKRSVKSISSFLPLMS
jgi:xylulokinase